MKRRYFSRIFCLTFIQVSIASVVLSFGANAHAEDAPKLYLAATSGTAVVGSKIAVEVRGSSASDAINTVQFGLQYPVDKLTYVSFDSSNSPYYIAASSTNANGVLTVARGAMDGIVGDHLIATVYFTVLAAGPAPVSFDDNSALIRESDSTNILVTKPGGSYSFLNITEIMGCSSLEQPSQWVYRLYDPITYKHFYTPYMCEYYALPRLANYTQEGAVWNTTPSNAFGAVPVYRLYNPSTRIHFWSSDQNDIASAVQYSGYTMEGIGYYAVSPNAPSIYPIYRLYNAKTYLHLWTTQQNEISFATKNAGYKLEGTAFYTQ